MNVLPRPGSDTNVTSPPIIRASRRAMANPRPAPLYFLVR